MPARKTDKTLKNTLALAQINPCAGALKQNTALIADTLRSAAEKGAVLTIFPHLAVTGYPPLDLLKNGDFKAQAQQSLQELVRSCPEGAYALIGAPVLRDGVLFDGAVLLGSEGIKTVVCRRTLTDYPWFAASSYFETDEEQEISLVEVPGLDFKLIVSVGGDLLEDENSELLQKHFTKADGSGILVNLASRAFVCGTFTARASKLCRLAARSRIGIAEANLTGAQDNIILEGGSLAAAPDGSLIACAPILEENLTVFTMAVPSKAAEIETYSHAAELHKALCLGLKDYMSKNGFTDVVLGISGGIDSALCAALAVEVLGSDHVHGIYMPSCYNTDISRDEGAKLCANLGMHLDQLPIEGPRKAFTELLAPLFEGLKPDITEENQQARIRAILVMSLANKFGWLAICTGNKSECACGYSTLYGDGAGGLAPIADLYKHEVRDVCRYINRNGELIPDLIITRPPSAELRPDQKDSDSLPEYDVLDPLLFCLLEKNMSRGDAVDAGFDPDLVDRVMRLLSRSEFKRRQSPIGLRVSSCMMGIDRLMPITNRFGR